MEYYNIHKSNLSNFLIPNHPVYFLLQHCFIRHPVNCKCCCATLLYVSVFHGEDWCCVRESLASIIFQITVLMAGASEQSGGVSFERVESVARVYWQALWSEHLGGVSLITVRLTGYYTRSDYNGLTPKCSLNFIKVQQM